MVFGKDNEDSVFSPIDEFELSPFSMPVIQYHLPDDGGCQ